MRPIAKIKIAGAVITAFLLIPSATAFSQHPPLYMKPTNAGSHWSSFENLNGAHGNAAKENKGGKGHAWDSIAPGETKTLMDAKGAGMITRMWLTIDDRSTETLRSLRLDMFWDNVEKPAVSVPFGDFFNAMLTEPTRYENELFSTGEGRSFNCFIPMPFHKSGKVTLTNETKKPLKHLFYDIDYVLDKDLPADALYFHSHWHRSLSLIHISEPTRPY